MQLLARDKNFLKESISFNPIEIESKKYLKIGTTVGEVFVSKKSALVLAEFINDIFEDNKINTPSGYKELAETLEAENL